MYLEIPGEGHQLCEIDTGSNGVTQLDSKLFRRLIEQDRAVLRSPTMMSVFGGNVTRRTGILSRLRFGPHILRNVPVSEGKSHIVGMSFLARFDATFDFPKRMAYFVPAQSCHLPECQDSCVRVERSGAKGIVFDVDDMSVAEKASIRAKDVILEVNGVSCENQSLILIRQQLSQPEVKLNLTLEREGVIHHTTFALPKPLDPFPTTGDGSEFMPIPQSLPPLMTVAVPPPKAMP